MSLFGISSGFPELSPAKRHVAHALLTRSPLSTRASPSFSFDLHVLSMPPAFVLSQDQTLQFIPVCQIQFSEENLHYVNCRCQSLHYFNPTEVESI